MIIDLMFIPNHLVLTRFHPVAYMIKLNIEISMASLIRNIATSKENDLKDKRVSTAKPDTYQVSAYARLRNHGLCKLSEDEHHIVRTEEYEIHT